MTKVNRSTDCGNSPKNKMVEDIGIALEIHDAEFLSTVLCDETEWNYSGSKKAATEWRSRLGEKDKPASLTIDHVMTHGKLGAVNGCVQRGEIEQRFCHVIEFTSTKCNRVKRIESYGAA